ncbi:hypothetical protein [Flavobacterium sp.]|uniref:hypothetical protein n=1 Tax=Flavobacterium sp. TaxID=239 RepID=UPI00260719D4|nr:hypothetical protein [Flavobacterium sp.]MDG2432437.1 hypothetical protein [Flavobacterium sp.]
MKRDQFIREEDWENYLSILSSKVNSGFVIEEKNDKLPFTVLSKENRKVNHNFNLLLCCITLGLWLFVWAYLYYSSNKKRKILVAIDEDGKTFVENCF